MSSAIASAVVIRRAVRDTTLRRLSARLECPPSRVRRALATVDAFAAVLDALGLEVCARP